MTLTQPRASLAAFAAALLVTSACGGSDPKVPPGGNNGTPDGGTSGNPDGGNNNNGTFDTAQISQRYAQTVCAYTTRCRPVFRQLQTEQECVTEGAAGFKDFLDFIAPAVTAGRTRYNAQKLDECLTGHATLDCVTGDQPAACADVFTGAQAANAPCFGGYECASGLWCNTDSVGGCGRCEAFVTRGADCSAGVCGDNMDCFDVGQANPICLPVNLGENQPCGTAQTGLCLGEGDYGALQCVGDQMGGNCRRPASGSEACDPMATSAPACNIWTGQRCDMGMCANIAFVGLNQMCGGNNFCSDGFCAQQTMQCTPEPTAGQPCGPRGLCGQDTYCDDSGSCVPLKPNAASCVGSYECTGDLLCIGLTQTSSGTCGSLDWRQCN
jgi:hypothetical protein